MAKAFDHLLKASQDAADAGFNNDLHASAEYRAHLVKVMAKRALEELVTD